MPALVPASPGNGGGATGPVIQDSIGLDCPQSRHCAVEYLAPQFGQWASVAKVSKGCLHCPQTQYGPVTGSVRHSGQAKPSRLGSLAIRERICACWKPRQQLKPTKMAMIPIH